MNHNGFDDRADAARCLAEYLRETPLTDPLVLAIPRGGIEVGAVLAHALHAELDVVLARKLRAPHQPELALGAVGEDGQVYVDDRSVSMTRTSPHDLEAEAQRQLQRLRERAALFRTLRPPAPIKGRSVIVTDDGLATGSTMIAALRTVRRREPLELICAVPVAPPERLEAVRELCDLLVCPLTPDDFRAVGEFYRRFDQVPDERVAQLLRNPLRSPDATARSRAS